MPYDDIIGINSETKIYLKDLTTTLKISHSMLGRVVDFQGIPIDGKDLWNLLMRFALFW